MKYSLLVLFLFLTVGCMDTRTRTTVACESIPEAERKMIVKNWLVNYTLEIIALGYMNLEEVRHGDPALKQRQRMKWMPVLKRRVSTNDNNDRDI